MLIRLFWHWAILVLGLYLVTCITPVSYDAPEDLAKAALVLIIVNTILRPLMILFTLPLVILSLGFFLLILNALILYTVPHFVHGFHVPGFFSAFFGALILSVITGLFSGYDKRVSVHRVNPPARSNTGQGKIIDI